jgi:hypothetical protein
MGFGDGKGYVRLGVWGVEVRSVLYSGFTGVYDMSFPFWLMCWHVVLDISEFRTL